MGLCLLIAAALWSVGILRDRAYLNRELIRLHVVANSDETEDQDIKLKVRDAVLTNIHSDLEKVGDVEEAKTYLLENLPKIEKIANRTLEAAGFEDRASVSLCQECFDTRRYDTFSLPAGVYEALRIVIGDGNGKNWWCVAFPELCFSATAEGFSETAQTAGMGQALTHTLSGTENSSIRFFFLDTLGRAEASLFRFQSASEGAFQGK